MKLIIIGQHPYSNYMTARLLTRITHKIILQIKWVESKVLWVEEIGNCLPHTCRLHIRFDNFQDFIRWAKAKSKNFN